MVKIICEAGVNHNGNLDLCLELIKVCDKAGADIIKFQTYRADALSVRHAPNAEYAKTGMGEDVVSHYEMLKKYELTDDMKEAISSYVNKRTKLELLFSVFDIASYRELLRSTPNSIKIPSGEVTNIPLLREIGRTYDRELIISTGMATMREIDACLEEVIRGKNTISNVTLLHCSTAYPTPMNEVNMLSMRTIGETFGVRYGYSDHTVGSVAAVMAVALGASYIEKHITLYRGMSGPDHLASADPQQLDQYVADVRSAYYALGTNDKKRGPSEGQNLEVARKSIVASRPIKKGELLTAENISTKRPGSYISADRWDEVLGTHAKSDFQMDDPIAL